MSEAPPRLPLCAAFARWLAAKRFVVSEPRRAG